MKSAEPSILFVTRCPPNLDGFGGSQRAAHILRALKKRGQVDLLILYRSGDGGVEDFLPDVEKLGVRSCSKLHVKGWEQPLQRWPWLPYKLGRPLELLSPYSTEAPRLRARTIREIAGAIPLQRYDIVFAARLPSAVMISAVREYGGLEAATWAFDMDDIISESKQSSIRLDRARVGIRESIQSSIDASRSASAERRMLTVWDVVSVCTDHDTKTLKTLSPATAICKVPNVVDRTRLPPSNRKGARVLFVGSLAHAPNAQGLNVFLKDAWPRIQSALPDVHLDVVGMYPPPGMGERLANAGGTLHANVRSVEPYYQRATVVISPIFFGSGTRIKVLETMALGRAMVSTEFGAAGLGVEHGTHALIANEMPAFAEAVVQLCLDPSLRHLLEDAAHHLVEQSFSPDALDLALEEMISGSKHITEVGL